MATTDASEEVRASAPSSPPRENLVRATPGITLQRAEGSTMPTLTGHFAVWDQWTEIRSAYEGNFLERFAPGSMTKTLAESTPKVLFQHGKDPQVGEKPLGTVMRLAPDAQGAAYEVALLDTSYNRDLLPGLEAGLYGASFRFSVIREDVVQRPQKSDYNPRGLPERTVQESRVAEFGPVVFPAYAGATAGIRSMTDEFLFDVLAENHHHLEQLARRSSISLNGLKRFDNEDVGCLAQMIQMGSCYIDDQDETGDATDIAVMQGVVKTLADLMQGEIAETEPAEPADMPMRMNSSLQQSSSMQTLINAGFEPDSVIEAVTTQDGEERAMWSTAYIDSLPDSSFLHVEPGGKMDEGGMTMPRSLRHFPYKDAAGNVDMPHLRNALARIPQSSLPQTAKDAAAAKAEKILAAHSGRDSEPEPSEATTRTPGAEPEPSEATTHSNHGLFRFVEPPKHLRSQ